MAWCIIKYFLLFFGIPLLYYYIILKSSINFCLSSGDIYLSLVISLSCLIFPFSFIIIFELFYGDIFETFIILSAIFLPIKSPVASAVFWIALFEAVLSASISDCLASSRRFWLYLPLKFVFIFLPFFGHIFWQKAKIHSLLQIFDL